MGLGRNSRLDSHTRVALESAVVRFLKRRGGNAFTLHEIRDGLERTADHDLVEGVVGILALSDTLERLVRTRQVRRSWDGDYQVYKLRSRPVEFDSRLVRE
jgi:hypothetical protein